MIHFKNVSSYIADNGEWQINNKSVKYESFWFNKKAILQNNQKNLTDVLFYFLNSVIHIVINHNMCFLKYMLLGSTYISGY